MKNKLDNFYINSALVVGAHMALFISLYFIMTFLGFIKGYPTNESLVQWDANWYKSIVDGGYVFVQDKQSNIAFFPLFPLLWKLLHLSPFFMSVVNWAIYIAGMVLLRKTMNFSTREFFLLLSIPSGLFFYLPYSESVFFFSGSLLLYGLKKDFRLALLGVFLTGLSRSAAMVFIPIIIFSMLYNFRLKTNNKRLFIQSALLIVTAIASTLLAQFIVYLDTGKFFALFEVVEKTWFRVLSIPEFYLTSWGGANLVWLDGLALFTGLLSAAMCLTVVIKKALNFNKTIASFYLFSIGYLALVTLTTLLYSYPTEAGGTTVHSLNRYVFATPFFVVFFVMGLRYVKLSRNALLFFAGIALFNWLLFDAMGYLLELQRFALPIFKTKIYFGLTFVYSLSFLLMANLKIRANIWSGVYVLNLLLQIFLFGKYLTGGWVG